VHINCSESLKFRSFEEDLIDDRNWQKKDLLIKQVNLPILSLPVETHLDEFENKLEESLREVNRRISDKENKSFEKKQQSSPWSLKYPAKLETDSDSFFDTLTQIDLFQVLQFVDSKTDFISSFKHLRGKYAKHKANQTIISVCLMAWGTNTGIGKMSKISDLGINLLQTTSGNFIRPETLREANRKIVDEIVKFDLFHQYNISEEIHSSSDGQKFETKFPTINARLFAKVFLT
jgi:hypothetical protein